MPGCPATFTTLHFTRKPRSARIMTMLVVMCLYMFLILVLVDKVPSRKTLNTMAAAVGISKALRAILALLFLPAFLAVIHRPHRRALMIQGMDALEDRLAAALGGPVRVATLVPALLRRMTLAAVARTILVVAARATLVAAAATAAVAVVAATFNQ